jgi:hypothetical protein
MWYLEYTSGKNEYDSNEHTHLFPLGIEDFSKKEKAKSLAKIKWGEQKRSEGSFKELYRDPQLVWKEPIKD